MAREESSDPQRIALSATANIFVGNERFLGRVVALTSRGMEVIPSVRARPQTFVRLNFELAGFGVLDIDALIVQEIRIERWYGWQVRFFAPDSRITRRLRDHLERRELDKTARSSSRRSAELVPHL
jgi:hypothetical protein